MQIRRRPILLVDDEPLYRTSTAALLRNSGCLVTTAASTEDAMRLIREQPVGLAMVDLNLPGNVRELRNVVERGLSLARGRWIEASDLPVEIVTCGAEDDARPDSWPATTITGNRPMDRVAAEREYLVNLLRMSGGNVTQAAERAGVSRQGLHRILQRHGITAREFRGKTSGE